MLEQVQEVQDDVRSVVRRWRQRCSGRNRYARHNRWTMRQAPVRLFCQIEGGVCVAGVEDTVYETNGRRRNTIHVQSVVRRWRQRCIGRNRWRVHVGDDETGSSEALKPAVCLVSHS